MSARVGYRLTEIGEIPEEWDVVELGHLVNYEKGKAPKQISNQELSGTLPYLGVETLRGGVFHQWAEHTDSLVKVNPNDTILIWDGFYSGEAFIGFEGVLSSTAVKIEPKVQALDRNFLYNFLKTRFGELNSKHSGMFLKHVSKVVFESLNVPLPPLPEQRKIASILSTVDETIQKTHEIIAKTQQLKKGLMQQLLTKGIGHTKFKKTEIGDIPQNWTIERLDALISIEHGFAFHGEFFANHGPVLLTPGNFAEDGGLYFNDRNLKRYSGEYPSEYELKPGDLIVVMTDLSPLCKILGNPALIPEGETMLHNQRLGKVKITSDRLTKNFLYYVFLLRRYKNHLKATATGSTVRHTAPSRILQLRISVPPIGEQEKMVSVLSAVDDRIRQTAERKQQLERLKEGLMQVLLTGEVRVKVN